MRRGEIWLVDLPEGIGSEHKGFKYCVVVQNDIGNAKSAVTIVCPISSKIKLYSATHLMINCLAKPSCILFEQIKSVDKTRFKRYVCTLDDTDIMRVNSKLASTLGL